MASQVQIKIDEIAEYTQDNKESMLLILKWLVQEIMPADIGVNSDVKSIKDKKQGYYECRQMIVYKLKKIGL